MRFPSSSFCGYRYGSQISTLKHLQKEFLHEFWVGQICVKYARASVLTSGWDGPRKSLAFHRLCRFENKILNHIDHSLVASLPMIAKLAHILMGCMYIPLAL